MGKPRRPCSSCGGDKPPGRRHATCGKCGPRTYVPAEVQDRIVRLYQEGKSTEAIGREVFWEKSTVKRVLELRGVRLRARTEIRPDTSRRLSQDELDRTVELYASGLSVEAVADRLGLSQSAIVYRLRKVGALRSKGEGLRVMRCRQVAAAGRGGLTPNQRAALGLIEREPGISTSEVAKRVGVTVRRARYVLLQLERFGLVRHDRPKGEDVGAGRPCVWRRTELPLAEVLTHEFWGRHLGRPTEAESLPIEPLRAWINDLIQREERKARFSAVSPVDEGDGDGSGGIPVAVTVARRLGITDRRLYSVRNNQEFISITVADRLLTHADLGVRLEDLWPHLAEMEMAA